MSLLWRNRIQIVLAPSRVTLVRLGRGIARQVVDKRILPVPSTAGATPWEAAVKATKTALNSFKNAPADVKVVVSNHFAHFLLLPQTGALDGAAERDAYARLQFGKAFGVAAEDWAIQIDTSGNGTADVACATERALIDSLHEACAAADHRLVSVQPYLMAAFNTWRKQFDGEHVWLVLVEPEKLCLAVFRRGQWHSVRTIRVGQDWHEALSELLEREMLVAGTETVVAPKLYLFAPDATASGLSSNLATNVRRLQLAPRQGFTPSQDVAYAMAMMGA